MMKKEHLFCIWGVFNMVLLLAVILPSRLSAQTYGYVEPLRSAVIYSGILIPVAIQQIIRNAPSNSSVMFSNIMAHSEAGAMQAISDVTVFIINPSSPGKCPEKIAEGDFEPERAPSFPGGTEAMNAFLVKQVHYPEVARAHGIQGTVWVEFTVEPDGSLTAPKVTTPLFPPCDEEALRAVMAMPKWIPGLYRGLPVRSSSRIPITFQMSH